jgi:Flp pilus assembly protein TadD
MRRMHKLGIAATTERTPAAVACAKNAATELGGADILLEHNQALHWEHQRPPRKAPDVDPPHLA